MRDGNEFPDIRRAEWAAAQLPQLIIALGRAGGLDPHLHESIGASNLVDLTNHAEHDAFIKTWAAACRLEVSENVIGIHAFERPVTMRGPSILRVRAGRDAFLAIVRIRFGFAVLLCPDLSSMNCPVDTLSDHLAASVAPAARESVERLIRTVPVRKRRKPALYRALMESELRGKPLADEWRLSGRLTPSLMNDLSSTGIIRRFVAYVFAYAVQYALWLLSWALVGQWALQGSLEKGWIAGWLLLLLTIIPIQLFCRWCEGSMAIRIGARLKERILVGTMNLDADTIRGDGPSRLLSRVLESNILESAILNGGFVSIVASIELAFSAYVMMHGAAGPWHLALLTAWIALMIACFTQQHGHRSRTTGERLHLTHRTVAGMVGYRTRLAQQPPLLWHEPEDALLEGYHASVTRLDRWAAAIDILASRGWMLMALAVMLPAFLGRGGNPAAIAVSIGGILIAERAFVKWIPAAGQLSDAMLAWHHIAPVFRAAGEAIPGGHPAAAATASRARTGESILAAHDLLYRYAGRPEAVIRDWSLSVKAGDRILLQGPSGAGKSTICSLLAGWRQPASGLLLLNGIDRHTMGFSNWRRRVVAVPQFHDNHVIAETFAFNLLMGRQWPPTSGDLEEARQICNELGLDALLRRMPAGMFQLVGETGWQLSHGEKSRLFIARALLQRAEVVLLDESLAALDAENVERSLDCVFRRAKTLIVVAHP